MPIPLGDADTLVLMPYGTRPIDGKEVDYDELYWRVLAPGIRQAGHHPYRVDELRPKQSLTCLPRQHELEIARAPYAVADVSFVPGSVYIELGKRDVWDARLRYQHPGRGVVLIAAEGTTDHLGCETLWRGRPVTVYPVEPSKTDESIRLIADTMRTFRHLRPQPALGGVLDF